MTLDLAAIEARRQRYIDERIYDSDLDNFELWDTLVEDDIAALLAEVQRLKLLLAEKVDVTSIDRAMEFDRLVAHLEAEGSIAPTRATTWVTGRNFLRATGQVRLTADEDDDGA